MFVSQSEFETLAVIVSSSIRVFATTIAEHDPNTTVNEGTAMNGTLDQQRAAMGVGAGSPSKKPTERVWKMFTDEERVKAIKAERVTITIGSGAEAREVVIRPLNPRTLVTSYALIQAILVPLIKTFEPGPDGSRRDVSMQSILTSLGDNIDKLPELIYVILKRGNEISKEWIDDNLDILLDLQLIIPLFLEQNGLGKLMGNDQPPVGPTLTPEASGESQQTAA